MLTDWQTKEVVDDWHDYNFLYLNLNDFVGLLLCVVFILGPFVVMVTEIRFMKQKF